LPQLRLNDEAVAVLGHDVADIGKLRLLAFALLVQLGLGLGRGGMRLVAALLAVEIAPAVAARRRRVARTVLRHEALHRGPRLNLRAVDREVLVREKSANLPVGQKFGEEFAGHLRLEQAVAVGTHTGSSAPSPTNHR
jgi:hypothetical protein